MRKLLMRLIFWALTEKLAEFEGRLLDVERHFVTKRDPDGRPAETLADVPFHQRKDYKTPRLRGASMHQRLQWLEATDGGRRVPQPSQRSGTNG